MSEWNMQDAGSYTLVYNGAKIHFFIAHGKGRFSPNLQTPAHRGRPRLLGGDSARRSRVSWNGAPHTVLKREKMGGGMGTTASRSWERASAGRRCLHDPAAHLFPLSHSVARTIPQANAVSGRNLHRRPMRYSDTTGNTCAGPVPDASPSRGESPEGRRHPAAAMSRRDNSPVENGVGADSPKPLQGLHRAGHDGVSPRIARICTYDVCGVLRDQRAICEGGR